jgi:hypothetical protein
LRSVQTQDPNLLVAQPLGEVVYLKVAVVADPDGLLGLIAKMVLL